MLGLDLFLVTNLGSDMIISIVWSTNKLTSFAAFRDLYEELIFGFSTFLSQF